MSGRDGESHRLTQGAVERKFIFSKRPHLEVRHDVTSSIVVRPAMRRNGVMPIQSALAPDIIEKFIARRQVAVAAERANYQLCLSELCDLLGVPRPDPSTSVHAENDYVFDLTIARHQPDCTSSMVYADLYKRGYFILETTTESDPNHARPARSVWRDHDGKT